MNNSSTTRHHTGAQRITEAHQRRMQRDQAIPSAISMLADAGAQIAEAIDRLEHQPVSSVAIDIRRPIMIRLNAEGQHLSDKDEADPFHVATLFPQFGLIVDAQKPELASNWGEACEKGKQVIICGSKADGLLETPEFGLVIDRGQQPTFSKKNFPKLRTDYIYWTATPHPSVSSYASYVDLGNGAVNWSSRDNDGLVLACRRVSPRQ